MVGSRAMTRPSVRRVSRCVVLALALVACRGDAPKQHPAMSDGRCLDGWAATKNTWHGTVRRTISFKCNGGVPQIFVAERGRHGLDSTPTLREVSSQTWERIWNHLEKAKWRAIAARGIEKPDVEIEITDGTVTKKLGWTESTRITDQELDLAIALEVSFTLEDTAETP